MTILSMSGFRHHWSNRGTYIGEYRGGAGVEQTLCQLRPHLRGMRLIPGGRVLSSFGHAVTGESDDPAIKPEHRLA
jgi:hypothetical protein